MGFARKLKKKQEAPAKKAERKAEAKRTARGKVAARKIVAAEAAKLMVVNNMTRIADYCRAYWFPCISAVMVRAFQFGHKRLWELENKMTYLFSLSSKQFSVSNMRAALLYEAGYRFHVRKRPYRPVDDSQEAYMEMLCQGIECQRIDLFETVWLWALHDEFGFGAQRLQKAKEALRQYEELSSEEWHGMIDFLDSKLMKPRKVDGKEYLGISHKWAPRMLKKLSEPGMDIINHGIVMKVNSKRRAS